MKRSIALRLLACVLAPLGALIILAGLLAGAAIRSRLLASLDRELQAQAEAIAALTEWDDGRVTLELDDPDESPGSGPSLRGACYEARLDDGKPLFRSPSAEGFSLLPPDNALGLPARWDLTLPDGSRARATAIKFVPRGERDPLQERLWPAGPPEVTLAVAVDAEPALRAIAELRIALASLFAALLGACAIATVAGLRWGLRPLGDLASAVGSIDADSLGSRLPETEMPRELRPLAAKLNELLARLEASFSRERRFSADAAHELRTPVAELRALAEVALGDQVDERHRAAFEDALEISRRMQGVIDGLLTLARRDASLPQGPDEKIDLAAEIAGAWSEAEPRARARGLSTTLPSQPSALARGNRQAARLILRNLLDNAAEHADPSGPIEITTAIAPGSFEITIANAAPDLSQEDAERMFERFWRKDSSRASAAHCGLGLPIARALAESQGWTLAARLASAGRLAITLSGSNGSSSSN